MVKWDSGISISTLSDNGSTFRRRTTLVANRSALSTIPKAAKYRG
jgi:hypothetical protein